MRTGWARGGVINTRRHELTSLRRCVMCVRWHCVQHDRFPCCESSCVQFQSQFHVLLLYLVLGCAIVVNYFFMLLWFSFACLQRVLRQRRQYALILRRVSRKRSEYFVFDPIHSHSRRVVLGNPHNDNIVGVDYRLMCACTSRRDVVSSSPCEGLQYLHACVMSTVSFAIYCAQKVCVACRCVCCARVSGISFHLECGPWSRGALQQTTNRRH